MFDVLIIGCGVVGAALAYELSKHELSVCVLEKENDVAVGTTKANSAILHSGYDPKPGTLMARLNVESVPLTKEICRKLDVPCKNIGSLTVAFSEDDMETVKRLYERGVKNGVPGLEIIGQEELRRKEPHISPEALGALWAPSAAIISPWELCLAMAQTAVRNGTELYLDSEVTEIKKKGESFIVKTSSGVYEARNIVNCAGVFSDKVHAMIAEPCFKILPHSGEYFLLDKCEGDKANTVIFQCPGEDTKGILVSPTVHGNLIVGPDNAAVKAGDLSVDAKRLQGIKETARKSVPDIGFGENIRNFAGIRAVTDIDDFIIGETEVQGFYDVAGIKSPGLSAAAAIGVYVKNMLEASGVPMRRKKSFVDERHVTRFNELTAEEKREAVEKNPLYGRVICRCETVTEGEIVDCIHAPIPPCSIDGVKRRVGAGMGRCQGGFCSPRVLEILARELGRDPMEIEKDKKGTYILTGRTKGEQA
ncbi:MAG: NAD(P)/FAD-dependent oxidoreductase [Oscillospiraceae bacterium]|nr:NAD(P)/FAD-dependent oxidoreductase [Oscillospiraceae bacterium]